MEDKGALRRKGNDKGFSRSPKNDHIEKVTVNNQLTISGNSQLFDNSFGKNQNTNMSSYENREQAFKQQNVSFNDVRDDFSEEALTFSNNQHILLQNELNMQNQEIIANNIQQQIIQQNIQNANNVLPNIGTSDTPVDFQGVSGVSNGLASVTLAADINGQNVYATSHIYENDDIPYQLTEKRDTLSSDVKNTYSSQREFSKDKSGFTKTRRDKVSREKNKDTPLSSKAGEESLSRKVSKDVLKRDDKDELLTFKSDKEFFGRLLFDGDSDIDKDEDDKAKDLDKLSQNIYRGAIAGSELYSRLKERDKEFAEDNKSSERLRYNKSGQMAQKPPDQLRRSNQNYQNKNVPFDSNKNKDSELKRKKDVYEKQQKDKLRAEKDKKDKEKRIKQVELHKKEDKAFQARNSKNHLKSKKKKKLSESEGAKKFVTVIGPILIGILMFGILLMLIVVIGQTMLGLFAGTMGDFVTQNDYTTLSMTNEYFTDLMAEFEMFVSPGYEDNYESKLLEEKPDIYEFIYNIPDEFRYPTVLLKAYLSAKYKEYDMTDGSVQTDLNEIFESYATYWHEIKYEDRPFPAYDDYGHEIGTSLKRVPICYIYAELGDMEEICKGRLDDRQVVQLDKYMASGLGQAVFSPVMKESWGFSGATYRVTSDFGYRVAPLEGASTYHGGIDIGCPTGTKLYSAVTGTVTSCGNMGKAGNAVFIKDDQTGITVVFMHMSSIGVSSGQHIKEGEFVGESGASGNVTGPHLHMEVRDANGNKHDPRDYIPTNF